MIKKLNQLLLVIVYLVQIGCAHLKQSDKKANIQEFEGVITYHEIEIGFTGLIISDTVKCFYSHGNFINIHSNHSSKFHIVKDYYFGSKSVRLMVFNNSDTLHQLSLNLPVQKLDSFKVIKLSEQILSRNCENIKMNISYHEKDSTTYTDVDMTFSRGYLKINKEHFKNWNLGFFNKAINESGSYFLSWRSVHFDSSHKKILSAKMYYVISVKEMAINPKIFEINNTKIEQTK